LPDNAPLAVVLGCSGERLTASERDFFAGADPVGFILFRRNCSSLGQVRDLVGSLRGCVGRDNAPVLIDQEGGRVARLRPPHWRLYPSAARLASLPDPLAETAARLGARLIADDLAGLGVTVDCLPVLDVPVSGAASVIGRARVDSHYACPRVETSFEELVRTDFAPFRALAAMPWAMTAHIVYSAIDPTAPATLSRRVVAEIIRGEIGFDGVLVSDDLSMRALCAGLGERTRQAVAAGCDLALHCNGNPGEMDEVAAAARPISPLTATRLRRGEAMRRGSAGNRFDRGEAEAQFDALLAGMQFSELAEQ
jgi:beta-N-acetylhexosaminidase